MGAHSLGKATRSQNGFDGVWTPNEETTMNTTYFENMVARNLTYKNVVKFVLHCNNPIAKDENMTFGIFKKYENDHDHHTNI